MSVAEIGNPALWAGALGIVLLNLPFGFWRAGQKRFTSRWFIAIHTPILLSIGLRLSLGVGWKLATFPLFGGAFFAGQFLGGRFRSSRNAS